MTLCRPFGPTKLDQQVDLSVSDISDILSGKRNPRVEICLKLMRAAQASEAKQYQADQKNQVLLEMIRDRCNQQSTRKIAKQLGINPANLSHALCGKRKLTEFMQTKLEPLFGDTDLSSTL